MASGAVSGHKDAAELSQIVNVSELERAAGARCPCQPFHRAEQELARKIEELARSNYELEQFAFVAAHDLQEPLRMVAAYTRLLSEKYHGRLDADADRYITYASEGALRLQTLIRDLLTYSRLRPLDAPPTEADSQVALAEALRNLSQAIEESGSVLICFSRVVLWLCVWFLCLNFNSLPVYGIEVGSAVDRVGHIAPFNPVVSNIQRELSKLEPLKGITENISVTHVPIDGKHFLPIKDCLHVIERKCLSSPRREFRQRARLVRLNDHFVQNIATAGIPEVSRNGVQFLTSKHNRPRVEECGALAVVPDYYVEFRKLKDRHDVGKSHIPEFEFLDFQSGDRDPSGNICADFGSISALLRGSSLSRHLRCLLSHHSQLPQHGLTLPLHFTKSIHGNANTDYAHEGERKGAENLNDADNTFDKINRFFWCGDENVNILLIVLLYPLGILLGGLGGGLCRRRQMRGLCVCLGIGWCGLGCVLIGLPVLWGRGLLETTKHNPCGENTDGCNAPSHNRQIVSQKGLTPFPFCNTVSLMANVLNTDKQIAVI